MMSALRTCSSCGEDKPLNAFNRARPICRACTEEKRLAPRVCLRCGEEKPSIKFSDRSRTCLRCYAAARKAKLSPKREQSTSNAARPRQARNSPGTATTSLKFREAAKKLDSLPASDILAGTAELVRSVEWPTEFRPEVLNCLLMYLDAPVNTQLDLRGGEGWQRQRVEGRYLPPPNAEKFLGMVYERINARTTMNLMTDCLAEAARTYDFDEWASSYSTGADDVAELFDRAAQIAAVRVSPTSPRV